MNKEMFVTPLKLWNMLHKKQPNPLHLINHLRQLGHLNKSLQVFLHCDIITLSLGL